MADILKIKESPAVIAHVEMMQGVINRLADISARCKEWCFAFIGALLVLILSQDLSNSGFIMVAYLIVALFYIMDSYYLGLERQMREYYQEFVKTINEINDRQGGNEEQKLAQITKSIYFPHTKYDQPSVYERLKRQSTTTLKAMCSLSTMLPYGILIALLIICHSFLNNQPGCCS